MHAGAARVKAGKQTRARTQRGWRGTPNQVHAEGSSRPIYSVLETPNHMHAFRTDHLLSPGRHPITSKPLYLSLCPITAALPTGAAQSHPCHVRETQSHPCPHPSPLLTQSHPLCTRERGRPITSTLPPLFPAQSHPRWPQGCSIPSPVPLSMAKPDPESPAPQMEPCLDYITPFLFSVRRRNELLPTQESKGFRAGGKKVQFPIGRGRSPPRQETINARCLLLRTVPQWKSGTKDSTKAGTEPGVFYPPWVTSPSYPKIPVGMSSPLSKCGWAKEQGGQRAPTGPREKPRARVQESQVYSRISGCRSGHMELPALAIPSSDLDGFVVYLRPKNSKYHLSHDVE